MWAGSAVRIAKATWCHFFAGGSHNWSNTQIRSGFYNAYVQRFSTTLMDRVVTGEALQDRHFPEQRCLDEGVLQRDAKEKRRKGEDALM
jgi:hypothetical protein